jgi:hypothetical protein
MKRPMNMHDIIMILKKRSTNIKPNKDKPIPNSNPVENAISLLLIRNSFQELLRFNKARSIIAGNAMRIEITMNVCPSIVKKGSVTMLTINAV